MRLKGINEEQEQKQAVEATKHKILYLAGETKGKYANDGPFVRRCGRQRPNLCPLSCPGTGQQISQRNVLSLLVWVWVRLGGQIISNKKLP